MYYSRLIYYACFRTNCIPEESEIDIHDLLGEQHAIALIWDTGQVRSHYPHLTEEQAWEVLQECERNYKGEEGLCWDDLAEAVTELYPAPEEAMRPIRISRCDEAMQVYKDTDQNANLVDFLADAMLWCEAHEVSFEQCLGTATMHFNHETNSK